MKPWSSIASTLGWALASLLAVALVLLALLREGVRWIVFAEPWWATAAIVPVMALVVRALLRPRPATMRFSRSNSLRRVARGWAVHFVDLPDGMRLAAAMLLCFALARPQSTHGADRIEHEGIDIVIALDLSESMETPDLAPNRLGAAQRVIDAFIVRRPRDRIGLVAFGSSASTVSPLTIDHGVLRSMVRRLQLRTMDGSTTAIGAGLGMALNRLGDSEAASRVIVLLTDGVHNADGLDPDAIAREAATRGVQIYTVLMGQHGRDQGNVDPARLERVAATTGGYAYTAADENALSGSFQDLLDKLERSEIAGESVLPELFAWLLWPALALLVLELVLRNTRLRRFP
ncbi:MAG: VWA domain-containing protein [Deltaproteobacteria bacterium]|nr:VWA domain-containing protein [Deltaproteobacteria bacterium]MBP7286840.1 VWA domain-containing protein [Nannocystaceae bacterium]